jgi:predicted XRE-type DNA-binding protein
MTLAEDLKRALARELCAMFKHCDLWETAELLRLHLSEASRLRNGQTRRFSMERLLGMIAAQGYDIEIHAKEILQRRGEHREPHGTVVIYDRYGNAARERFDLTR